MKGLVLLLYLTARYKVVVYRPFLCNYIIVLEKQLIQPKSQKHSKLHLIVFNKIDKN